MSQAQQAFKWVGTRPVRPDGVPKVTGAAKFGADYYLPGMLYGRVLRSPTRMPVSAPSTPRAPRRCQG